MQCCSSTRSASEARGRAGLAAVLLIGVLALLPASCATYPGVDGPQRAPGGAPPQENEARLSGSQLWSANCGRCHRVRSPASYSDDQWAVAVHHMAIKGHLTLAEREAIERFLQAGN